MRCFTTLNEHTHHGRCLLEHHHAVALYSLVGHKQLTPSCTRRMTAPAVAHSSRQAATAVLAAASPRLRGTVQEPDSRSVTYRNSESPQLRQQQWPEQRPMQPQSPLWGYLTGTDADQWTWDDDYNPNARVSSSKHRLCRRFVRADPSDNPRAERPCAQCSAAGSWCKLACAALGNLHIIQLCSTHMGGLVTSSHSTVCSLLANCHSLLA